MNFIKNFLLLIIVFFTIISCKKVKNSQLEIENILLSNKIDSLQAILDSIVLRPYIDNMNFKIKKGEVFNVNILAVNKGGVSLSSLSINGKSINLEDSVVSYNDFGPSLRLTPDSVGKYKVRAEVRMKSWGSKIIPLEWPLTVLREDE